ncbi:MAG: adenosylhomocysteinase [Ruminococcaceae bacterium]|nr:adenosylhomocysteinase [Oscillospiraceae bacterium]
MTDIRDINLWESGKLKIDWVTKFTSLLNSIEEDYKESKPLKGKRVALSIHLEAKTARLCQVLKAMGAEMYVTGCNPLSTQDDVAAALAHEGMNVFGKHGATAEEYENHISAVIAAEPDIIIDDGGDLINCIHSKYPHLISKVLGGCEETTTGIHRLENMDRDGKLMFPMITVNNAKCKYLFDNRYGTGQSVWNGINRTTNLIVAGKNVVVAGYGWCGKGVAMRAKGLGASVIVTEIDPIKAIEAVMDGFKVMPMEKAAEIGDVFVTVTGCRDIITEKSFLKMKDGAILCNAGHFDVEVDVKGLKEISVKSFEARQNIMGYTLSNGNTLYVIAEGRLVNLASGDGHPAEIMDMSFAIQALSVLYLATNRDKIKGKVVPVPEEIDNDVAMRKLKFLGVELDVLTDEQKKYLNM